MRADRLLILLLMPLATAAQTPRAAPASAPPSLSTLATDKDGRIRTQLSSRNFVTIAGELSARISSMPLREGDAFRAGQALVSFDCSLVQAQLRKAEAGAEAAQALADSNERLAELNSVGKYEVAHTAAKLKEAQAEVAVVRTMMSRCTIGAPFDGRIVRRHVAAHHYVQPGTPLLDILETGQLELQMIVPSRWLTWLKPGIAFQVEIEELGQTYPAKVQRLGAQIDPVSQTLPVIGVIEGPQATLLPGMSGWAVFAQRK